MNDIENMSIEEFRDYCRTIGVGFTTDPDTGEIYTTQNDEDLRDFVLTVLETFGRR